MNNQLNLQYLILLSLCIPYTAVAHDTTHIHPLITLRIAKLIKTVDVAGGNAYQEIYELNPDPIISDNLPVDDQFLYWGTDFDPLGFAGASDKVSYLSDNDVSPWVTDILVGAIPKKKNVITGVVYEDVPALKVFNHFYHANDGRPLTVATIPVGIKSSVRAMGFFNQAVDAMGGYTESSKENAFFLFGQALHHVEDMSSPAHIHNDAHLTSLETEKDDYEGWWLPQRKRDSDCGVNFDTNGCNYFVNASSVNTVTNPWQDIWGTSPGSMVQDIYFKTTYHAQLEYTFSVFEEIANSYEYYTNAGLVNAPAGEMQQMFPCNDGTDGVNCLHWSEDAPDTPAHWVITGVGDFQHQFQAGLDDNWWPIEVETNLSTIGQEPAPFGDTYYIEQLASNNNDALPKGDAVTPVNMRASLGVSWVANMQPNSDSILELYARSLLSPAVTYGAGFTQYWYDIANTPPYLQSAIVEQQPATAGTEQTVYSAKWIPETSGASAPVDKRLFQRSPDIKHIHAKKDLVIKLDFNEPIKQITQLLIGKHNTSGVCIESQSPCRNITPPPLDASGNPVVGSGLKLFNGIDVGGVKVWRWEITVPKAVLSGLNGKLILAVKALDKNNHRGGETGLETIGGDLDSTPDTPARRDLSKVITTAGVLIPGANEYRWYDASKGLGGKHDQFSYDYLKGDQNHTLLFDTGAPTPAININIDLTL